MNSWNSKLHALKQSWESAIFFGALSIVLANLVPSIRAQIIDALWTGKFGELWVPLSIGVSAIIHHVSVSVQELYLHEAKTHRSVDYPLSIEKALKLANIALLWLIDSEWVRIHRNHHSYSDAKKDPHSPKNGLWNFFNFFTLYQRSADEIYDEDVPLKNRLLRFTPIATIHIPSIALFWADWLLIWALTHVWFKLAMLIQNGYTHSTTNWEVRDITLNFLPKTLRDIILNVFFWWAQNHWMHHKNPGESNLSNNSSSDWGDFYRRLLWGEVNKN